MSRWDVAPHTSLEVLMAEWMGAMVTSVSSGTIENTYRPHAGRISTYFADKVTDISKRRIVDYSRERLGKVHRTTVQKELATRRSFLTWCVERELLDVAPEVPELPSKGKDGKHLTLRAAMEQHRTNAVCASCHNRMDPLGFAWRTSTPSAPGGRRRPAGGSMPRASFPMAASLRVRRG